MKVIKNRKLEPITQLYYCPQEDEYYVNYGEFIRNLPCDPKVKEYLKEKERYVRGWQSEDGSSYFVTLTFAENKLSWANTAVLGTYPKKVSFS